MSFRCLQHGTFFGQILYLFPGLTKLRLELRCPVLQASSHFAFKLQRCRSLGSSVAGVCELSTKANQFLHDRYKWYNSINMRCSPMLRDLLGLCDLYCVREKHTTPWKNNYKFSSISLKRLYSILIWGKYYEKSIKFKTSLRLVLETTWFDQFLRTNHLKEYPVVDKH